MSAHTDPAEATGADSRDDAIALVRLQPRAEKRVARGHPWLFSNELEMTAQTRAIAAGALARFQTAGGELLGTGTFNPHALIAGRMLAADGRTMIDGTFLAERLDRARHLRARFVGGRHHRLVHAEADGLPGLVVDRHGEHLVVQLNSAGMERLWPQLAAALDDAVAPAGLLVTGDDTARQLEGLAPRHDIVGSWPDGPLTIEENGIAYLADPVSGQKTGWFYDHRDNRRAVAALSDGRQVLDAYSYAGGFALACAAAGAAGVLAIDRSEPALAVAAQAAQANGLAGRCRFRRAEVFAELAQLHGRGELFDLVICDPPAFAKTRKQLRQALKGYRKLAWLAARVVAPGGVLFIASCSHHVHIDDLRREVASGLRNAGRSARIVRESGAAADHPVHPVLPESAYLKALTLALD